MTDHIAINEYYLVISNYGYLLKTKNHDDYEAVRQWEGIVFEGVVKNSQFIHFLAGHSWRKKSVFKLSISKPFEEVHYYDFHELDTDAPLPIRKISIGSSKQQEVYENL